MCIVTKVKIKCNILTEHNHNEEVFSWLLRGNTTVNATENTFFQESFFIEGKGIQL